MKSEYIHPFLKASCSVLEMLLGQPPCTGEPKLQKETFTSYPCNVVCGVTGMVQGQVIFGMAQETAENIASAMLCQPVQSFDALAASAIAELANMISGNAMLNLSEAGFVCDITPPSIIRGMNIEFSTLTIPAFVLPLSIPQGELTVQVSLQGRKQ